MGVVQVPKRAKLGNDYDRGERRAARGRAQRLAARRGAGGQPQSSPGAAAGQAQGSTGAAKGTRRRSPATGTSVYVETARILRGRAREAQTEEASEEIANIMSEFTEWFERDNPERFDATKFEAACA